MCGEMPRRRATALLPRPWAERRQDLDLARGQRRRGAVPAAARTGAPSVRAAAARRARRRPRAARHRAEPAPVSAGSSPAQSLSVLGMPGSSATAGMPAVVAAEPSVKRDIRSLGSGDGPMPAFGDERGEPAGRRRLGRRQSRRAAAAAPRRPTEPRSPCRPRTHGRGERLHCACADQPQLDLAADHFWPQQLGELCRGSRAAAPSIPIRMSPISTPACAAGPSGVTPITISPSE